MVFVVSCALIPNVNLPMKKSTGCSCGSQFVIFYGSIIVKIEIMWQNVQVFKLNYSMIPFFFFLNENAKIKKNKKK